MVLIRWGVVMDVTGFLDNVQERVSFWFKEEEVLSISAQYEFWVIAVIVLLLCVISAFLFRRKASSVPLLETVDSAKKNVDHSSDVFLQLLLVESKLIFERYQSDIAAFSYQSIEDSVRLDCAISGTDFFVYNSGFEDLKALKHSALRLQIVKAYTQFKLVLCSIEQCQKQYSEYVSYSRIAASSQKPIDDNASAKSRLMLQKRLRDFEQENQQMTLQMEQMLTMIRSVRQKR